GMGRTSFGGRGSYRICSRGCRRLVISRRDPLPHGTCLAKSSTSNRRERIAYRELVLERLRLVPKGHWTLAGGANHRFVVKIESEPRPGLRKSRDNHSVAPAGARRIFLVGTGGLHHRLISVTPPALVI